MRNKHFYLLLLIATVLMTGCSENGQQNFSITQSSESSTSSVIEENNVAQVVILLGQSNMEGHTWSRFLTNTMADKAAEFNTGYDDVQIAFHNSGDYTSGGEFTSVKLGQGLSMNQFGPEVGIAEVLHNANKENVFLLKYAHGATSLSGHWISPSSRRDGGPLYRGALQFVLNSINKIEDMGYYPEIKAICWMQGEDDSNNGQHDNYYTYTKNFVKDLREDLILYMDLDGIGFLDAAIAALDSVWRQHVIINNAKQTNANEDPLSFFIDTNKEGLKTNHEPVGSVDIYHYDSSSMIKLGRLFGELLVEHFIN